jgi:D-3-phosphoglycerate dehydrogenase
MDKLSLIVVVGSVSMNFLFEGIVRELQHRQYSVVRYIDSAEFFGDRSALTEADVLLATGQLRCTRELMANAPKLRAVISPFTGTEGFDEGAATELGIVIANSHPSEHFESIAEATVMLMLEALYDLRNVEAVFRRNLPRPSPPLARMLRGKIIGLIGFGKVARAITIRLSGWQVQIQTYAPAPRYSLPPQVQRVSLDHLLRTSDIVSIHASLNEETRGLLDRERLRLMKSDAILINTARGAIVDQAALIEVALERPQFKIALDVFDVEAPPPDGRLRALPNAILTRHMVGHTRESMKALRHVAVENIARVLEGRLPLYLRNREVIQLWTLRWGQGQSKVMR